MAQQTTSAAPAAPATTPTTPATTPTTGAAPATGQPATGTTETTGAAPTGTTATTAPTAANPATPAAQPEISEEQKQKYTSASDPDTRNGIPFNVYYGKLDAATAKDEVKQFSNNKNYVISCYFIPKFVRQQRLFEAGNSCPMFKLTYNKDVKRIVLEDKLDSIGMSGFVEIDNKTSWMDVVLERHNNYYFVIVISEWADKKTQTQTGVTSTFQEVVKYEPYIFDIDSVMNLSAPNVEDKKVRVYLVDLMTSILNSHSIASVIRFNTEITKAQSYKRVFEIIMNYIKCHLKINLNDAAHFYKDLLYRQAVLCGGNEYNGYDSGNDMSQLVNASFGKINRNATIREALYQLLKDCVTTLKTPKSFAEAFESIGDVLVPFFFKEEYPDRCFLYPSMWIDSHVVASQTSQAAKPAEGSTTTPTTPATPTTPTTTTGDSATPTPPADGSTPTPPATTPPAQPATPPAQPATWTRAVTRQGETPSTPPAQPSTPPTTPNVGNWVSSVSGSNSSAPATAPASTTGQADGSTEAKPNTETPARVNDPFKTFYMEYGDGKVLMRQVTMRDMFMPFFLAFGDDKYYGVYDHITPNQNKQEDLELSVLNQIYQKNVRAIQFDPIDMNKVRRIWKNMVFIDCSSEGTGGNSTLIFFDWIYQYFSHVFLNKNKRGYVSNIIPTFYVVARSNNIGTAASEGNSFDSLFDEYNAYTIATETEDTVNECLRMIGKNVASFVLLNDVYTYTIEGDILRRPNEIVKMNFNLQDDTQTSLTIGTDLSGDSTLLMYMRKVIHDFSGNEYTNIVSACKICEYVGDAHNVTKTFKNNEGNESAEPAATPAPSTPATPAAPATT